MPQPKKTGAARRAAAAPSLPPVTVARFEQATLLIERLVAEKQSLFLAAMTSYRDQHRAAVSRPLDHEEAASIAAGLAAQMGSGDVPGLATQVQQSGLRAYDDPQPQELLAVAGVRTAPAFLDVALRVCSLLELPAETFEAAKEGGMLDEAIARHAETLRALDMPTARARASAALEHFAQQVAGASPGEAWGLLTGTVWAAIQQAVTQLASRLPSSDTSQLTGSLERTGGDAATSSTT